MLERLFRTSVVVFSAYLLIGAGTAGRNNDIIPVREGGTLEIAAEAGAGTTTVWTLVLNGVTIETVTNRIYKHTFGTPKTVDLLADLTLPSGEHIKKTFTVKVLPSADLTINPDALYGSPAGSVIATDPIPIEGEVSFPLSGLVQILPIDAEGLTVDFDLAVDRDGDGDGGNDPDNAGMQSVDGNYPFWIWYAKQGEIELRADAKRDGVPANSIVLLTTKAPIRSGLFKSEDGSQSWVDVEQKMDQFRIREKIADLRAVTVDPKGENFGFYFASNQKGTFVVYRNGTAMKRGEIESVYDSQEPVVFRMTASGDLLYALHNTDLYVNQELLSQDQYSFSKGVTSVHDEGGVVTFPEGGSVMQYDIAREKKTVLYRHVGSIEYMRRKGNTVAYTLREKGFVRMYRNGRRVSVKAVENPENFAIGPKGDVYFFVKAARGYSLYRDTRSFVTGKGDGAYVDVDPDGHVWHLSYVRLDRRTSVRLQKDRGGANLLPADVVNVELFMAFPNGGYALRAAFAKEPTHFWLVRDGKEFGQPFLFEYPHNDMHGMVEWGDSMVLRAFDDNQWRVLKDGDKVDHASFRRVWFYRVIDGELIVYATR